MVMTMIINVTFAFYVTLHKVAGIRMYKQNAESYKTKLNFSNTVKFPWWQATRSAAAILWQQVPA